MGGSRKAAPQRSQAPATRPAAPPALHQKKSGGMLSGIGSTIAQGMAFGTGSAMAHQAVGAVVGAVTGGGSDEIPRDAIMDGGVQQQATGGVQQQAMNQSLQGACAPDEQ